MSRLLGYVFIGFVAWAMASSSAWSGAEALTPAKDANPKPDAAASKGGKPDVAKGEKPADHPSKEAANGDKKPAAEKGKTSDKGNAGKDQKKDKDKKGNGDKKDQKDDKKDKKGDKATKSDEKSDEASPTHTVKRGPLKVTFDLDGVFEAKTSYEIAIKPDEWNGFVVENAVPHGAHVRKGDVLVTFDTEKIDRTIADLSIEQKLADVAVQLGESQLLTLEKTTPWDVESTTRAARIAEEERKYYLDVAKPFAVKMSEFSLKMAEESLEYEREELHQLEKMYKADDITEETEQIVLKRARDSVEKAQFMVEYTKLNRDESLKYTLPRLEEIVKDASRRKSLEVDKTKVDLPLVMQRQRLEVERLRTQRDRAVERLKSLQEDRKLMKVESPADGVVYYGKCTRGRFGDATGLMESLSRNGSIQPNQVFMTVVEPRPMFIRATVSEGELHNCRPGLVAEVKPTAYPDAKLKATLDDVSDIPISPGGFNAVFAVQLKHKNKLLMPGMTCKLKLTPYVKKDAISVPSKALMTDDFDEDEHYVWLPGKDGKPQKRPVTIGKKTDKQIEILSGLAEGEKILLEAPKDEK